MMKMLNIESIVILGIIVFMIIVLFSVRRKCYYCHKMKFITGRGFDKVICRSCKNKRYGRK